MKIRVMRYLISGLVALVYIISVLGGFGGGVDPAPESHIISPSGVEWGVRVEVVLTNGGKANFVCPKFNKKPRGAHGRECYLEAYDNTNGGQL